MCMCIYLSTYMCTHIVLSVYMSTYVYICTISVRVYICIAVRMGKCSSGGMGWLPLVGSLKLYVSLENIGLFYRALLQKRPIILRSLLAKATPYVRLL